ncbi:hypothetical protein GRF29_8g1419650 [Pseudopithomyces chartarum]|uniref:Uncharacterized protein n=1 Tax=Pseudopithomyces chartarum TaxID=1892770 RepID=A0AAN6M636_9PLEO|nr:hypothetical protein GRF29_8g1419650 [Pseudopithomyces chartarum]
MTTPTWQIHLRIIPQPSTTNPTAIPRLQIQTPTGLRDPQTHELLELNIPTVRLATIAARCAVMNVNAYAQETEFIMRIRPRGGRIFEAELFDLQNRKLQRSYLILAQNVALSVARPILPKQHLHALHTPPSRRNLEASITTTLPLRPNYNN